MSYDKTPVSLPDSIFVIRIWSDEMTGQIRATTKNARDGTQYSFASLPLLIKYLTSTQSHVK